MRRKLPPLKSLIAFEAAARHMSITKAADELCVVPAAVSHHVRALEDWLGAPLFRHENRALVLTDTGRAYTQDLKTVLDALADATSAVMSGGRSDRLAVTAPPSFTTKWLLPRLQRFRERHPEIDLNLSVSASLTDCTHESTDVAIHYSRGEYHDLHAVRLGEVELFPVCRPGTLLDGRAPPKEVAELSGHTLLHDDMLRVNERMDWRYWLQSAGAPNVEIAERGLHFNQAAMAYQAAIDGHGIVLAKSILVGLDLANRRLVRPFAHGCRTGHYYCFICRPSRKANPKIAAFGAWLQDEMKAASHAVPAPPATPASAAESRAA